MLLLFNTLWWNVGEISLMNLIAQVAVRTATASSLEQLRKSEASGSVNIKTTPSKSTNFNHFTGKMGTISRDIKKVDKGAQRGSAIL